MGKLQAAVIISVSYFALLDSALVKLSQYVE